MSAKTATQSQSKQPRLLALAVIFLLLQTAALSLAEGTRLHSELLQPDWAVFVPFFAVPDAATIPSLSRFARLGKAKVVALYSRMTPQGYVAELTPAWDNFPTDDHVADTARMNRELQAAIRTMPAQYYWVHKRFKTRPAGQDSLYK